MHQVAYMPSSYRLSSFSDLFLHPTSLSSILPPLSLQPPLIHMSTDTAGCAPHPRTEHTGLSTRFLAPFWTSCQGQGEGEMMDGGLGTRMGKAPQDGRSWEK